MWVCIIQRMSVKCWLEIHSSFHSEVLFSFFFFDMTGIGGLAAVQHWCQRQPNYRSYSISTQSHSEVYGASAVYDECPHDDCCKAHHWLSSFSAKRWLKYSNWCDPCGLDWAWRIGWGDEMSTALCVLVLIHSCSSVWITSHLLHKFIRNALDSRNTSDPHLLKTE